MARSSVCLYDEDEDGPVTKQAQASLPSAKPKRVLLPRYAPICEGDLGIPIFLLTRTWMEENPMVMDVFSSMAMDAASKVTRFDIALLTSRVCWEFVVERGVLDFEVPYTHRPYIARELLHRHPQLIPVLECRVPNEVPF